MCDSCKTPFPANWGRCPDCNGARIDRNAPMGYSVGIPLRYSDAHTGSFSEAQNGLIADFVDGASESMFLTGGTGTGKTYLATAALQKCCAKLLSSGVWTTSGVILQELRATYGNISKVSEADVSSKYSEVDVLLIDDLGAEKITDWSVSSLYEIISKRINWCRKTIVTSNLGLSELAEWSPRIASRLASFAVVKMNGNDRRVSNGNS